APVTQPAARRDRRRGKQAITADEIDPLADPLARQPKRLVVVASHELSIGSDGAADREERIARAEPQPTAGSLAAFLPAPDKREHQAVEALRQRKVRIEVQRRLELGKRVLETAQIEIDGRKRKMRPGILAVGTDRRQCRA